VFFFVKVLEVCLTTQVHIFFKLKVSTKIFLFSPISRSKSSIAFLSTPKERVPMPHFFRKCPQIAQTINLCISQPELNSNLINSPHKN
jgi:hypothetical protein